MNIHIGNLAREVSDEDLREAFAAFGQVTSARVVLDRYSGQSRGYGLVEMPSRDEAMTAIAALNGRLLKGRIIMANEAQTQSRQRNRGRRAR